MNEMLFNFSQIVAVMVFVYALRTAMYRYNPTGFLLVFLYTFLACFYHFKFVTTELFITASYAINIFLMLFIVARSVYLTYERNKNKKHNRRKEDKRQHTPSTHFSALKKVMHEVF